MKKNLLLFAIIIFQSSSIRSQILAGGHWHSAFLCSDGTVNAWGGNDDGQLGDMTTTNRSAPVQSYGLTNIISIAVKFKTTMALKSDSTVWVYGLIGDSVPMQMAGLTSIIRIAAGNGHCMVLKSDSTVWTWGDNMFGQLGNGLSGGYSAVPAQVSGLTGVVDISGGDMHSLALKSDSTVWAWGDNDYGNLGDSTITMRTHPVQVHNLSGVIKISAGLYCNYALRSDSTVWAWGDNSLGKLGDSTTTNRYTPVQVWGLTGITAISAGQYHGMALKSDSSVWTWGGNNNGQLGNGNQVNQLTPILVPGLTSVIEVAGGGYHSLVMKSDSTVWAWGINMQGQLGNLAAVGISFTPIQTLGLCSINTAVDKINSDKNQFSIYPNPSRGRFNLSYPDSKIGIMDISIYNMLGVKVYFNNSFFNISREIDLSTQSKGIYFIKINSHEKLATLKILVE